MPYGQQYNALMQLNLVIAAIASRISDFTRNSGDFTRNRKLNASTTIKLILNMEGQSLNTELIRAFRDMNDRTTSSAFIQQMGKLSPDVFMHILREFNQTPHKHNLYKGKYQLYAIDGSDFNIPYQSKSKYALDYETEKLPKDGLPVKPCSILHANIMYNICDRTYEDIEIQSRSQMDERKAAVDMLHRFRPVGPYIVIMDRGYEGFNMIEHGNRLNGKGFYVIRTKVGVGGIREIANLPDSECDVDMSFRVTTSNRYYMLNKDNESIHLKTSPKNTHKKNLSPNTKYSSWDFTQFETVKCRVVKLRINDPNTGKQEWEVLLTTQSQALEAGNPHSTVGV